MTKLEAIADLEKTGSINSHRRSASWEKAFDLYNSQHSQKKRIGCGSCFREVLAWLRS